MEVVRLVVLYPLTSVLDKPINNFPVTGKNLRRYEPALVHSAQEKTRKGIVHLSNMFPNCESSRTITSCRGEHANGKICSTS